MKCQTISLYSFWCERRDLLCSHSKGDIFTCEDKMLFPHVKISSFRYKVHDHLVFHWCLHNKVISLKMEVISALLSLVNRL